MVVYRVHDNDNSDGLIATNSTIKKVVIFLPLLAVF